MDIYLRSLKRIHRELRYLRNRIGVPGDKHGDKDNDKDKVDEQKITITIETLKF